MTYIVIAVDYVSKWVKEVALPNNKARNVTAFLKKNIFTQFGTPRAILSDGGYHFCNKAFARLLEKYGVKNKNIKALLEKVELRGYGNMAQLKEDVSELKLEIHKMQTLEFDLTTLLPVEEEHGDGTSQALNLDLDFTNLLSLEEEHGTSTS
nr:uncharacterized protein LOC117274705 [Nicotiana tomentosiformis]